MPATENAQEVALLSWQQETGPALGNRAVSKVMQYEGPLGQLQEAIEGSNAPEAQKLMQDSHAAFNQLKDSGGAEALLETGHYDAAGRDRVCDMFVGEFCQTDTPESAGADDLMSYDPFYNPAQHPSPPAAQAPKAKEVQAQPQPVKVLGSFLDAVDNKQLCRKSTADVVAIRPLKKNRRKNGTQQPRTVLQLRGGGAFDDCQTYGSCGTSLCGDSKKKKAAKQQAAKKEESRGKAHERVKESVAATVNAFLDQPVIALGLVSIDLGCTLINMVDPWGVWYWISMVALAFVILQQTLEIYLHSSLVKKELMEEDTVRAIVSFWGDDGESNPIRIQAGQIGYVDIIDDADWRMDTGAFITFEGSNHSIFVSGMDFEDLEVTSGVYEYFCNPVNVLNVCILILVFIFQVPLVPSGGLGPFLIALRFIKPTIRLYARKDKVGEANEHHHRVKGEESEDENEGHAVAAHSPAEVVGTDDMNKILGANPQRHSV